MLVDQSWHRLSQHGLWQRVMRSASHHGVRGTIPTPYHERQRRWYSLALARDISDSFVEALQTTQAANSADHSHAPPLDLELARRQHDEYVQALRGVVPVLTLPAVPHHPDGCFVEDTVVARGRVAVVMRLGHVRRRGEVDSIKAILQTQLGMNVVDMRDGDEWATCDGGDVLDTGRHLFVGLSGRTNDRGANVLESVFGHDVEFVRVPMPEHQVLHLKSAVTHINRTTLLAPVGAAGDWILAAMKATERGYRIYRLPDVLSCNVVTCNGVVLAQDTTCQISRQILEEAVSYNSELSLKYISTSELAKKDAALTCCSILLDI